MSAPPASTLLVGFGRIGARHLACLEARPEAFSLIGVVEPCWPPQARVPALARFESLKLAMARARPELVVIASPSGAHAAQARLALKAGAHVVCEKPLAMSAAEAEALLALARRHDRLLIPCHQTRLMPGFERLEAAVAGGALGRLHAVNLSVQWARPQRYFDQAPWRGLSEQGGGVLMNQASHLLDRMLALMPCEQLEQIVAWSRTLRREIKAPDSVAAICRWPGGMATVSANVLAEPANFEATLTALGSGGSAQLGGERGERITRWEVPSLALSSRELEAINRLAEEDADASRHRFYEALALWLGGEDTERLEALQRGAVQTLRFIERVEASSRANAPVSWHNEEALA